MNVGGMHTIMLLFAFLLLMYLLLGEGKAPAKNLEWLGKKYFTLPTCSIDSLLELLSEASSYCLKIEKSKSSAMENNC